MRRHWSVKTGIFSPKIFLLASQRRSSNRNTENSKKDWFVKQIPQKTQAVVCRWTTCKVAQVKVTFALTSMMAENIL